MSHSVAAYSTAGVCAVCAAPLPDDAKLDALPEPSVDLNRSMRAGLAAPSQARRAVVSLPLIESTREKLALVVSELVTNAIRHAGLGAGDPIDLRVMSRDGHVRIAVRDGGPGFDPLSQNGNGSTTTTEASAWRSSTRCPTSGASSDIPTAAPCGARWLHDASPQGSNLQRGAQARYRRVRTTRSPERVLPAIRTTASSPTRFPRRLTRARSRAPRRRTFTRSPSTLTFADPNRRGSRRTKLRRRTQRGGAPVGQAPFVSRTAYSPLFPSLYQT